MKSSLFKATAFFAAAALAATVGVADAQLVDKDNAKCRGTVAKSSTKLNGTTLKAFDACIKGSLKVGAGDCSTVALVDAAKQKVSGARGKMFDAVGGIKTKCDTAPMGIHQLSLDEHVQCSSPSAGQALTTWSDVSLCLDELNTKNLEAYRNAILSPDFSAIFSDPAVKDLTKCANAIAKNTGKLHKTIQKETSKNQKSLDGGKLAPAGTYDYESGAADPKNKINDPAKGAIAKLDAGLVKSCSSLNTDQLRLLGSCDDDLDGIIECVTQKTISSAQGLTAVAYDQPGQCASQASVKIRHLDTVLDVGWTGFGHGADTADGFEARVDINCGAAPNDCSSCSVTASCEGGNCRCATSPSTPCNTPNGADAACGGGLCNNYFGPPLPLSAAGTPTCVVNKVQAVTGTANLQDGSSDTTAVNLSVVYGGIDQAQPCPTCVAGLCDGGVRDGLACSVDANSPTFGDLSYDCQPDPLANFSGAGLTVPLGFTSTAVSLGFDQSCDAPLGAFDCACAVCSGDGSVGCNSDADCAAFGAGTCSVNGVGAAKAPNGCADGTCTDAGNEIGTCAAGPTDGFCDGLTKTSGAGVAPCSTNADCAILGPSFGDCTIFTDRPCFLDPIEATGAPGTESANLVSAFCVAPTASSAINGAAGSPGPGRLNAAFEFVPYCSDTTTIWGPGGANCQ